MNNREAFELVIEKANPAPIKLPNLKHTVYWPPYDRLWDIWLALYPEQIPFYDGHLTLEFMRLEKWRL